MPLEATIRRVVRKELTLFFSSPVAYLFLAAFAAITLFIFFWGETFFARNIADVRPLFEWMPILLIFLTSALTMRMWSEERRSGTLEHVLTQPVPIWRFVVAKFLACLALLVIALVITLPLPLTVAMIGDLDWGPVWSGYLATLFLGAAYIAVGLFVSARSDNQIVSLISAVAVCGLFYLIGSPLITDFFGNNAGEWLRALGSGSRFSDITRGVIDVRDFVYYLSLIAIFLTLNVFSLERERWATGGDRRYHRTWQWGAALLIANAIAVNLWLGQINVLRMDTTEGKLYSISSATRSYLDRLQEPLLIRGYFSARTHPLLAPLVPQMRNLIREYAVAGGSRVHVEFVDPLTDPELEQEANRKYGIEPTPFQVNSRYQASLVNSYFNVLVKYGDQFQVLGFRDLIEVKSQSEGDIDVELRNPEYDITHAIRKVLLAYQSKGKLFDTVKGDIDFTAYISARDKLPPRLADFSDKLHQVVDDFRKQSNGRLHVNFIDPDSNPQVADRIAEDYGFKPMVASLFDSTQFYFYLTLKQGDQIVQIPLGDITPDNFRLALASGIKHFARGFTKTVAMVTPSPDPQMARIGMGGPEFRQLEKTLGTDLNIKHEDLADGRVDSDADLLLLAAPDKFDDKQVFAVDQFLMRGGTVIVATSPFKSELSSVRIDMHKHQSGLEKWLMHNGLKVEDRLVLDPRNSAFPIPVTRHMGSFRFQQMEMIDYPYFPELRGDNSLNQNNPITADLNRVTMAWASPISIDKAAIGQRKVTELLHSSDRAWTSASRDVMPQIDASGHSTFTPNGQRGRQLLGVIEQGHFTSYFAGQKSPLVTQTEDAAVGNKDKGKADQNSVIDSVIERSPESARIILFSSSDFVSDRVMRMIGASNGSQYLGGVQLLANAVDWSLEDQSLLSIRSRGHFNRTLPPMAEQQQFYWETGNYLIAIVLLAALAALQYYRRRRQQHRYLETLAV
jgi:ABC-2 type transport system permease protein